MPCDTITTMGIKLSVSDLDLLVLALKELGYAWAVRQGDMVHFGDGVQSFNKATGEVRVTSQNMVGQIKQSYAAQIVKAQAKKYGWTLKQTGKYEYQVTKR